MVVLRGEIGDELLHTHAALINAAGEQTLIALCYELTSGADGLAESLAAQRELTTALRRLSGPRAEGIPIFVVSATQGERVQDYAAAWDATEVVA